LQAAAIPVGEHGALTHMFQDLVLDDAFTEKGIDLTGRKFRMQLGTMPEVTDVRGRPKLYRSTDPRAGKVTLGNALFERLYDPIPATLSRPEELYPILKRYLPGLQ
jgi:hypothetical protein